MKLGNKGFAISSVLYMALVLFLILITSLLAMMGGRKNILDKLRNHAFANVNGIPEKDTDVIAELDIAFPTMTDNMIPIVYTPTGLVVKADTTGNTNRNWYNYNQRKWANAILVKESGTQTRSYYQSAAPGTTINTADILAYFVWIPRYKYTVDSATGSVNVEFISVKNDTSNIAHPAFTWDTYKWELTGTIVKSGSHVKQNTKMLDGIWVGKFETTNKDGMANSYSSGLTGITILPATTPISNESIKKMFLNSRKMEVKGNIYGFSQTGTNDIDEILSCTTTVRGDGTLSNKCSDDTCMTYCGTIENDSNNIDSHVSKNTEWGAVSLLSQSQYGINSTLTPNTTTCTGGGDCEKLSYIVSGNQSTTGNMYGIYDMAGSLYEITMGYYGTLKFQEDATNNYEISLNYYNKYTSSIGTKGDATNNDSLKHTSTNIMLSSNYFSLRGGLGTDLNSVGIYSYNKVQYDETATLDSNDIDNTSNDSNGFRVSLVIWE